MVWLTSSFFVLPVLMTALVRLAERSVFFHDGHCTVTSSVEVRGGRRQGRGWSAWQEAQCHTEGVCTQRTRQCCLSVCLLHSCCYRFSTALPRQCPQTSVIPAEPGLCYRHTSSMAGPASLAWQNSESCFSEHLLRSAGVGRVCEGKRSTNSSAEES